MHGIVSKVRTCTDHVVLEIRSCQNRWYNLHNKEMHIYIYIYIDIYVCVCVAMYVCMYVYIYILVKVWPHVKVKHEACSQDANKAQGKAECFIGIEAAH